MLLVILYSLAATYLALYGMHALLLVIQYGRHRHDQPRTIDLIHNPIVTVQLPLYNEPSVVERIIDAAGIQTARFLVGSYVTALEMAGCSVTVSMLDDELTRLWDAPVHTPALRWGM